MRGVARRQCDLFAGVAGTGERGDHEARLVERVLRGVGETAGVANVASARVAFEGAQSSRCTRALARRRRADHGRPGGAPPSPALFASSSG